MFTLCLPGLPIPRLQVDSIAAAGLGLAYTLTAILIFVLQNGYIDLFADDNVTARSAINQ